MRFLLLPALFLSAGILTPCLSAAEGDGAKPAPKPYTLEGCAVTGEKLGDMGEPVIKDYNGQQIKFCCKGCVKKFEKDLDKNLAKVQKQIAEQAAEKTPAK
jgi:hypothetical protein